MQRRQHLSTGDVFRLATCRASHDDYEDCILPDGASAGTAEDALDDACRLYLDDPAPGPDPL